MAEKLSSKEPLAERTLTFFRRVGNVTMVGAGITAVLYPPATVVAGAIIGTELAQNWVSKRFSAYLINNRTGKS
jgi:hypothetical protein